MSRELQASTPDRCSCNEPGPRPAFKTSSLAHEQTLFLKTQIVRIKPSQLTIEVATLAGKQVQRLSFDEKAPAISFRLGQGPVLGLGGGGANSIGAKRSTR